MKIVVWNRGGTYSEPIVGVHFEYKGYWIHLNQYSAQLVESESSTKSILVVPEPTPEAIRTCMDRVDELTNPAPWYGGSNPEDRLRSLERERING